MSPRPEEYAIIGVDPGKVTGVKIYLRREGSEVGTLGHDQVAVADFPGYMRSLISSVANRVGPNNVHISVEKFIITRRTAQLSQESDALEITGMVKALAATGGLGGTITVHQLLKTNLKFANDNMLKAVGWYVPGKRHANDAARQAFALLKLIDPPHWNSLVRDAKLESEDGGRKTP